MSINGTKYIFINISKVYQINAQHIRVLSESDGTPFPVIKSRWLDGGKQTEKTVHLQKTGSASAAFTNFSLHKCPKFMEMTKALTSLVTTKSVHKNGSIPMNTNNLSKQSKDFSGPKKVLIKKDMKPRRKDLKDKMDED